METFEFNDNNWYKLINFVLPENLKNINAEEATEEQIEQYSKFLNDNKPVLLTNNDILGKLNSVYEKHKPDVEHKVINMIVSFDNDVVTGILNCFVEDKQLQIRF